MFATLITLASKAPQPESSASWVVACLSAFGGAIVAFTGQWFLNRQASRELRRSLTAAAIEEVALIGREAAARVAGATRPGIPLRRPLPTEAWQAVQATPVFGAYNEDSRKPVLSLYREVVAANFEAAMAPTYLLIASLTDGPQAEVYDALAEEVSTAPFRAVRERVGAAAKALDEEMARL